MFMLLTGFPVQMFPLPLCWHLSVRAWLCDQPFFSRLLFHEHTKIPFLLVRNSSSYMCLRQVIGDFISDFEWITEFQQSFLWLTESRTEVQPMFLFWITWHREITPTWSPSPLCWEVFVFIVLLLPFSPFAFSVCWCYVWSYQNRNPNLSIILFPLSFFVCFFTVFCFIFFCLLLSLFFHP